MKQVKLSQAQYNELCCAGKVCFVHHTLWCIKWLTYFDMLAVSQDVHTQECELVKVVVE